MPPHVLTDAEKSLRRPEDQAAFHFWLDFTLPIHPGTFRRWFASVEARNEYIIRLPKHATCMEIGDER